MNSVREEELEPRGYALKMAFKLQTQEFDAEILRFAMGATAGFALDVLELACTRVGRATNCDRNVTGEIVDECNRIRRNRTADAAGDRPLLPPANVDGMLEARKIIATLKKRSDAKGRAATRPLNQSQLQDRKVEQLRELFASNPPSASSDSRPSSGPSGEAKTGDHSEPSSRDQTPPIGPRKSGVA